MRREDPFEHGPAGLSAAGDDSPTCNTLLDFFESGRKDGGSFDAGIQFALERMLVDPDFLLRVYRDSKRRAQTHLSIERPRSRLASVVLPVEQYSGRAAARPGRDAASSRTRRSSKKKRGACWPIRGRSDALVGNFAAQWLNLRRVEEVGGRSGEVSELRREPAAGLPDARRSSSSAARCARIAASLELLNANYTFVNERLARHYGIPGSLWQPLPARDAAESRSARRPAGAGRAAGDDLVSGPHVAGSARQMAAEQYFRPAGAAASAGRGYEPHREQARRGAEVHSRAAGAAPAESVVQQLSFGRSIRWGLRWRTST